MPPPVRPCLQGKSVLLTGGTGFLGKVIIERLLRSAPDLARIYLLIRPRSDADPSAGTALARFESEVLTSDAFGVLARRHGDRWPAFAREKLAPISGDVSLPRLGVDAADYDRLASQVDIVINAAASVVFDAPLDEAVRHNTESVGRIAQFARDCRPASLVHVSTAFVAGQQSGTIGETPLTASLSAELRAIEAVVEAAQREATSQQWDAPTLRTHMVERGMARAREAGWHDTYTYTKALGEMVLERDRGDVPTAIIRPTIIESSLREPMPGWLENLNVGDPLFVEFGRGRMPDFPLGLDTIFDIVPVDLVANAVVAVLPHVQEMRQAIGYYTIGSGALNPVTGEQLYEFAYDYFLRHPMHDRRGRAIPPVRLTFPTPAAFRERFAGDAGRSATVRRLLYLTDLYESYMNAGCVFDTTRSQHLLGAIADEDRAMLDFDVRQIEWRSYIQDIHLPGLRRHVLLEHRRPRARARERA